MGPIVSRQMLKSSEFKDQIGYDSGTTWEAIKKLYDMEVNEELMVF
jgi:hypothetical protein